MGVIVDWPGEEETPRRFSFLASESRPPACNAEALAEEQAARRREELNALYVAMTRAQRELVVSSVQPRNPVEGSWWQRLSPLCTPLEAPESATVLGAAAVGSVALPVVPPAPPQATPVPQRRDSRTPASRVGEALHRLLELHGGGLTAPPAAALARIGRSFGLDAAQLEQARAMALRIAQGEGAWAWDPRDIAWAADEVELVHEGEVLRLDRLVRRHDGAWWVLDHKSAAHPERDEALLAQLRRYARAIADLHPGAPVAAAFLTGDGRLVKVD
jgi:ATP-dependent helicase/nuclease subunit A